jgi:hypothetical protein
VKKPRRERPIAVVWNGQHFIPLPRFKRMCDEQFAVNEEYAIIKSEERNMTRHRGYFAALKDAFDNLAEEYANGYPSVEHLRAAALIEAGYCSESTFISDTSEHARELAMSLRRLSPLSIIRVKGNIVKHFEAESQSVHAMKKERFEASCKAVLEIVASMARTTVAELKKNAGRAA